MAVGTPTGSPLPSAQEYQYEDSEKTPARQFWQRSHVCRELVGRRGVWAYPPLCQVAGKRREPSRATESQIDFLSAVAPWPNVRQEYPSNERTRSLNTQLILLVGDTGHSQGLQNGILSQLGNNWRIELVSNGESAVERLKKEPPDALLAFRKLPDMTGVEVLKSCREQSPRSVRFLLLEKEDTSATAQTAGYAHQLIGLPVEPETVARLIRNSLALRKLLAQPDLIDRITAIDALPSPPEIYDKLVKALESDDASLQKVSDLIAQDIGITAKLLQLVNSAYFGLPRRIESIQHATSLLGLDTVQRIVFGAGVFRSFEGEHLNGMSVDSIYRRSMEVAAKSRLMAHAFGLSPRLIGDSLMGGMLHDVGKLILLTSFRDELAKIMEMVKERAIPEHEATRAVLGVDDAAIGAYLLALWGLPDSIVEAVALHYAPRSAPSPILNSLTTVHLGFALHYDEVRRVREPEESAIDQEYLERLGILDQLPSLQNFCTGAVAG